MTLVVFRLAPMSAGLRVVTWTVFVVPALFLVLALLTQPPTNKVVFVLFLVVGLIYASVWFIWRPSRFEVDAVSSGSSGLSARARYFAVTSSVRRSWT